MIFPFCLRQIHFNLRMDINELTGIVVDVCIQIHKMLGPGCVEKVYEEYAYQMLEERGVRVRQQVVVPMMLGGVRLKKACKLDLIAEDKLVIEIKTLWRVPQVAFDQVRTYLTLLNLKHGMLLNFKVPLMKHGIHRVFNNSGRESLLDP